MRDNFRDGIDKRQLLKFIGLLHQAGLPENTITIYASLLLAEMEPLLKDIIQEAIQEFQTQQSHDSSRPLLSVKCVAQRLAVSVRTVESLIALGEIKPIWIGGQRRFHEDTLEIFIRSNNCSSKGDSRNEIK